MKNIKEYKIRAFTFYVGACIFAVTVFGVLFALK